MSTGRAHPSAPALRQRIPNPSHDKQIARENAQITLANRQAQNVTVIPGPANPQQPDCASAFFNCDENHANDIHGTAILNCKAELVPTTSQPNMAQLTQIKQLKNTHGQGSSKNFAAVVQDTEGHDFSGTDGFFSGVTPPFTEPVNGTQLDWVARITCDHASTSNGDLMLQNYQGGVIGTYTPPSPPIKPPVGGSGFSPTTPEIVGMAVGAAVLLWVGYKVVKCFSCCCYSAGSSRSLAERFKDYKAQFDGIIGEIVTVDNLANADVEAALLANDKQPKYEALYRRAKIAFDNMVSVSPNAATVLLDGASEVSLKTLQVKAFGQTAANNGTPNDPHWDTSVRSLGRRALNTIF